MLQRLEVFDFEHTYVRLHENFVSYYTCAICTALELDPYRINIAAFYHDHGKYKWPKELFTKAELTNKDWETIKRHPSDASDIIFRIMPDRRAEFIKGDPSVADLILLHHEKPDGSGYYGIRDIPIESIILSVADIFDACLSDRIYREGMNVESALKAAVEPYADYLDMRGYSSSLVRGILKKYALKFKFERVVD